MLCLPPLQHDAPGQHPCFFTQHSGVSDTRVLADDIAYGETITVASKAISANFFMMKSPICDTHVLRRSSRRRRRRTFRASPCGVNRAVAHPSAANEARESA